MEMSKETEQNINQLQLYEQSLQNLLIQKQHFQSQLIEIDSALSELEKSQDSYKIINNIMVSASKEELKDDLKTKKETYDIRVKALEKQERAIKEKAEKLQSTVMESMKK
ncbi:MAG: prefoldin subunit beta [Nanoarchaeota archaeon]